MRVLILAIFGAQLTIAGAILAGAQIVHDGSPGNPIPGAMILVGAGIGLVTSLGARAAIESDRQEQNGDSNDRTIAAR